MDGRTSCTCPMIARLRFVSMSSLIAIYAKIGVERRIDLMTIIFHFVVVRVIHCLH